MQVLKHFNGMINMGWVAWFVSFAEKRSLVELRLVYTATDTDRKKTAGPTRHKNNGGRIIDVKNQRHSNDPSHPGGMP